MKKVFQIIFVLSVLFCFAQTERLDSGKYSGAKVFFESKYEKQEHQKFSSSQIKIEGNKVILGGLKSIEFPKDLGKKYRIILENGLLDPSEINGMANLKICCFEELPLLNPNPQTKRFSFWIFPKDNIRPNATEFEKKLSNRINPDVYYFELQNEKATIFTNFQEFVKGSKLTIIAYGGIII